MVAEGGTSSPALDYSAVPEALKASLFCYTDHVTYSHRVDNGYAYNFCIVPNSSYDVVLFGGLAVVLACLLQGKLNTLMVLVAGAVLMGIAYPVNLGALGNSLAIWLGISPWQLFFYVFLPPLLLDAAVRIDWFMFRKSFIQVFTLAFLVVGATCVAMIPIMLYMLQLQKYGWNWIHACMFGAMIASTDAVAIVSIMKTSGGPKRLRVMLEGESLLNDASGLTLFEVFFHLLQVQMEHPEESDPIGVIVGHVFLAVFQLGMIGFVMGMAFGVLTRLLLRYMRYMGAGHDQEVALTLGMAYLAYWITAMPCKGSGVVAVAVMGLYGAATNWWDMSTHSHQTFDGFWETLAFIVNSLVFLYSGASVINFFIRAAKDLLELGPAGNEDLYTALYMMPVIYVILCLLRFVLTMAFRPLFIAIKGDMSFRECIFICAAGLRGSASLIMGSAVVTYQMHGNVQSFNIVKAMMVFWTAGFVLFTLLINAPLLPTVLRLTGLSKVPEKQLARRQRALAALGAHTAEVLDQLRDAEDELLAGVDWAQVAAFVDHGRKYSHFTGQHVHKTSKLQRLLLWMLRTFCCCCGFSKAAHTAQHGMRHSHSHGEDHSVRPPGSHKGGRRSPSQRSRHGKRDSRDSGAAAAAAAAGGVTDGAVLGTLFSRDATNDIEGRGPVVAGANNGAAAADGVAAAAPAAEGGPPSFSDGLAGYQLNRQVGNESSRKYNRQQQQQQSGAAAAGAGDVSDIDDSGSTGSSASSGISNSASSSGSEGDHDGLLTSVLPAFSGFGDADIDVMECPFMTSTFGAHTHRRTESGAQPDSRATAASGASVAATGGSAAEGSMQRSSMLSRFWTARTRKLLHPQPSHDLEAQQQVQLQPLPPKEQPAVAATAEEPGLPDEAASAAALTGADGALPPLKVPGQPPATAGTAAGGARLTSAFAAAAASRTSAAADSSTGSSSKHNRSKSRDFAALGGGSPRSQPSAAPALRSLATRSAAPAFVYGDRDRAAAAAEASSSEISSAPRHARKASAGSSTAASGAPFSFKDDTAVGGGGISGWDLNTTTSKSSAWESAAAGSGTELHRSGSSPRAGLSRPPLTLQMDKALGRTSGAYRGLATRSVNLNVDRSAGGAGFEAAGMGAAMLGPLPPQLPEGKEAQMGCMEPGGAPGYDAAAAAVDMVSLARSSSRRGGGGSSNSLASAGGGGGLARPGVARSLASRSASLASAYGYSRPGSEGDLQGLATPAAAGSFGRPAAHSMTAASSSSSSLARQEAGAQQRSLATRSVNPHIPPVALIAPSLYTISAGLGAYQLGAAGAAGSDRSGGGRKQRPPGADHRSLASRSVPAAQAVALAAAAARGRQLPAAGDAAATAFGSTIVRSEGGEDAELSRPDSSSSSVLNAFQKSMGRMSKISAMLLGGSTAASRAGGEGDSEWEDDDDLGKMSGLAGKSSQQGVSDEELADARSWLLSGLKRYFYGKRMEGLLSARGLRILDAGCEVGLEDPSKPLDLWRIISRDAGHNLLVRLLITCLFMCRRTSVWLHRFGAGAWLTYPLRVLARTLQRPLNKVLLSSVEVAMEYLMGLTTSPYVEWLQEGEVWSMLLGEIQAETSQVAQFLIDREIEAPERYSAVQSYRVAMAVLRQQRLFVESLFESGMLDAAEQSLLAHPIEAAERRLELLGPVWKAPSLSEVLRQLPFMRGQSTLVLSFFIKYGHLVMLGKGSSLPEGKDLYIVQSGIVKVTYQPDLGAVQEYFLGAGGVFNLYTALTGEDMPGTTSAVAQGNALGKGPVLFCFSAKGLSHLSSLAAAGDPAFQQLELDMYRLAGLLLVERLRPQVDLEVSQALARLAPLHSKAAADRSGQHHRHKRMSRQHRAAWVRQRLNALRCHLKQQLVKAELLMLPAGCTVAQQSHVLLLQGSMQVHIADAPLLADPVAAEVARWMVSAGRHQHQSILPWLWEVLADEDLQQAPAGLPRHPLPVTITAGAEGATLLVCPSAAEEAAMAAAGAPAMPRTESFLRAGAPAGGHGTAASGRLGSGALQRAGTAAAAGGADANPFTRISDGLLAGAPAAAAAAKPGAAAGLAAQLAGVKPTNPFLRRTLAAAAAADSVMEPLPGAAGRAHSPADAGAGGLLGSASLPAAAGPALVPEPATAGLAPAATVPALAAGDSAADPLSLSPTMRELARVSPIRVTSSQPLAGADIDNTALVGATSTGTSLDEAHTAAARRASLEAPQAAGGARQQPGATTAAAPAAGKLEPRRSRSMRPLRALGGKDAASLK